jgi:hypothetical protein
MVVQIKFYLLLAADEEERRRRTKREEGGRLDRARVSFSCEQNASSSSSSDGGEALRIDDFGRIRGFLRVTHSDEKAERSKRCIAAVHKSPRTVTFRITLSYHFKMFSQKLASAASRTLLSTSKQRLYSSTTAMGKKVAVLGAAGGIGQPLSLLLKLSPQITELSTYDIVGTPGVAADLSHIPSASSVTGNLPSAGTWPPSHDTGLEAALKDASVVVIPAGVPRKPGMTRDDLFNTNAGASPRILCFYSCLRF